MIITDREYDELKVEAEAIVEKLFEEFYRQMAGERAMIQQQPIVEETVPEEVANDTIT